MPKKGKQTKNGNRPFLKKNPLVAVLFFFPAAGRQIAPVGWRMPSLTISLWLWTGGPRVGIAKL
eukprot:1086116-Amphidinium_carterae.1